MKSCKKYINYGGRIAIFGDYSHYTSKPLKGFHLQKATRVKMYSLLKRKIKPSICLLVNSRFVGDIEPFSIVNDKMNG